MVDPLLIMVGCRLIGSVQVGEWICIELWEHRFPVRTGIEDQATATGHNVFTSNLSAKNVVPWPHMKNGHVLV
jgi:hypothetical protein